MSQLLIPGPQQIERGALPMVPGATVAIGEQVGIEHKPANRPNMSSWRAHGVEYGARIRLTRSFEIKCGIVVAPHHPGK